MATWAKLGVSLRNAVRRFWPLRNVGYGRAIGAGLLGTVLANGFIHYKNEPRWRLWPHIVHAEDAKKEEIKVPPVSMRRLRFNQFASMIYEEEPYMTPRDFLHSVLMENVDCKLKKKMLTKADVDDMIRVASRAEAGNNMFRGIGDKGLISYTEYLFLLTILTKPETGFHIAFKMLDIDGNEHVDKKEFQKLKKIIRPRKELLRQDGTELSHIVDDVNTTLEVFFFGKNGKNKLHYKDFCRFMEDLQAEVQEVEFLRFSNGMKTMRREDFAEWLLHYTNEENNEAYWENMRKRIPTGESISFDEFKEFCLFTYHLEDFAFSVKMINEANRPIGMAEFKRAVKIATGHDLSENVLDTVFKIFDLDGDNCLSHKEFLAVMKDRVLRGLRVQHQYGISGYWKCVKRETLQGAQEALRKTGSPV
ncbi:calcium uptake protein 2, mitochondrial [Carassius auratus]|uniref:Calcium uptake protein 2, mitochondrial n=1 Tax=Carassius auratus TaxID=7957 RepID=A0A6P6K7E3_CARAU|nr:calcium uptake protein 2, mitochondrial-like [Carassius auratus]XP_052412773.1 calcium uptake protein 2, mitochondrial [Carassius gibelio]